MISRRTNGIPAHFQAVDALNPGPAVSSSAMRDGRATGFPKVRSRLHIMMAAVALVTGSSGALHAQQAFQTPSGTQVPILPDRGAAQHPSLQPGKPGAPSFTQPAQDRPAAPSNITGERLIAGPLLPNPIDAGLADAGLGEPGASATGGKDAGTRDGGAKDVAAKNAGADKAAANAQPKPAIKLPPPAGADLAYGAYQRGYYATAAKEAEARLKTNPNDAAAATLLGVLYDQGLGVPMDLARAARWFAKADSAGSPPATFALAMMTLQGRGVDKNDVEGRRLLEKAAKANDGQANYNLALLRLAEGTPSADRDALELLQRAADVETPEAQYLLATLYRKGRGAVANDIKATDLLRRAAGNRLQAAEIEYAIALFNGNGVRKDEAAAARLFLKASLDGNAVAQNRMARLLTVGRGLDRNLVEAAGWHLLASGRGLDDAWLDGALKDLSPTDRSKAEAFAAKHREPLIGASQ